MRLGPTLISQQDSQEFMRLLVDSIHDELKKKIPVQRPKEEMDRPGGYVWRT